MKKSLSCACAALLACLFVQPMFAADGADARWNGTWKINRDKSKLTGDTFLITEKPGGMMHYTSNSSVSYDFACDGRPHSTIADRTITCTGSTEAGYDYTTMAGNNTLSKSHRTFSADGKILMIHGTRMNADGSKNDYDETYKRVTGSKGLAGKWIDVKTNGGPEIFKYTLSRDSITYEDPKAKEIYTGKLDGTLAAVTGPNIPEGAMGSFKAEGPMKLRFVNKYKDKVLLEGIQTLSADGKTITEESWEPGKMNEKATIIWERD